MIRAATAFLFLLGPATPALAEITFRTGELPEAREKFLRLDGPFITEGFEGLQSTPNPLELGTVTITATRALHVEVENDRAITQGVQALGFEEDHDTTVTFTFSTPITAFGIDINDLNYTGANYADNLGNTHPDALAGDDGSDLGGEGYINRQFIGVINDTPFTSVSFTFQGGDLGGLITFDTLIYRPASLTSGKSTPKREAFVTPRG